MDIVETSAPARAPFDRGDRLALATIVLGTATVAYFTIGHLIHRVGHPGGTLDDSYIHFQYARAIAEGHPLRYTPGEPRSSGGTSFVWPLALAIPYALGMHGESILWAAWAFSFAALGALAWEIRALGRRIAGDVAANGAAALIVFFPPFAWFAASGMEVLPFAWLMARAARRAAEWSEGARTKTRSRELVAIAWILPLIRPEGAVLTLALAATRLFFSTNEQAAKSWRARLVPNAAAALPALAIAFGAALPTLVLLATTGQATSSTAQVKLLASDPYLSTLQLAQAVLANLRLALSSLLNGGPWSIEFLPKGGAGLAIAGIVALVYLSKRSSASWRGVLVVVFALCLFTPCLYVTFLWNRLRYLWPFAPPWILGLACLSRLFGEFAMLLARSLEGKARAANGATAVLFAAIAIPIATKLPGVVEDVAASASGIDRQQVDLGHWVKEHLDKSATVGVNDTGAIAYFGDARTFDVVGLTTPGEARYWVAGAASRFEHYEHLFKDAPSRLPTHFAVYPQWFDCEMLRGAELTSRTVTDSTILGGETMSVYQADYSTLGSGEAPWSVASAEEVTDSVDVADLDSERAHRYDLAGTPANVQILRDGVTAGDDPRRAVDGGRMYRSVERFVAHLGAANRGIARLDTAEPSRAEVHLDGAVVASFEVVPGGWREYPYAIPAAGSGGPRGDTRVEIVFERPVAAFHHWFVTDAGRQAQ